MKTKILSCLLVSAMVLAVRADDIVANDGTVYKDVTIQEVTPLGINFVSSGNTCWLDYRDMPTETAKKYGYDPAKAAAFEKGLASTNGNTATATTPVTAPATVPAASAAAASATVVTPVASTTVTAPTATVVTPVASVSTTPASVAVTTPVASVSTSPEAISVVTPIASVTLGQAIVPAPSTKVIVVNPDTPVEYDTTVVYEPTTTVWVLWNGRYYPRYWWHYWYWDHHWVRWNGRYYPGHVFYGGGRWHGGHYYPRDSHGGAPSGSPGYHRGYPGADRRNMANPGGRGGYSAPNRGGTGMPSGNRGTMPNTPVYPNSRGTMPGGDRHH